MKTLRVAAEQVLSSRWSRRWPLRPLIDALRRRRQKRRVAHMREKRERALSHFGSVSADELLLRLRELGVAEGQVVFCQVSLNDLHTFAGGARELLAMLRRLVGTSGTLLMPAYTATPDSAARRAGPVVFDLQRAPTYTGLVCELFRRSSGTVRSAHPRHSLCAAGPRAEQLTAGHEHCRYADGEGSPFDRLRREPDARIVTLGLAPGYTSFLHWLEDIDPARFPIRVHRAQAWVTSVRMADGTLREVSDRPRRGTVASRLDCNRVARRLSRDAMSWSEFKGLAIGIYRVDALAAELLALRDQGVVHYH